MPEPTPQPSDAAASARAQRPRTSPPGPRGLYVVVPVVATVATVVALIGLGLLARPVETPTQDCGSALVFLLDGRSNEFVDVDDPPAGVTRAEAEANNDRPCRERVADSLRPGAIMLAVGLLVAVIAALTESLARGGHWFLVHRERKRRRQAAAAAAGHPEGGGLGGDRSSDADAASADPERTPSR